MIRHAAVTCAAASQLRQVRVGYLLYETRGVTTLIGADGELAR